MRSAAAATFRAFSAYSSSLRAEHVASVVRAPMSDAATAFDNVWNRLSQKRNMIFPREIIWLNGAPGSGKTRNSRFMMDTRGFGNEPIVMSEILAKDSTCRQIINHGEMVKDEIVLEKLFDVLLQPHNRQGALVDGFPRTSLQVQCLTKLRDKMKTLRMNRVAQLHADGMPCTADLVQYPLPRFLLCILYVSEEESMRRQLKRGEFTRCHNERVRLTGTGSFLEERPTDFDRELIAKRYKIFEQHKDTLLALQDYFPFSVIDAERSIEGVQRQILKQFRYQSNQELRASTFDVINRVALASKIRYNARDALVMRLDEYEELHAEDFAAAVALVNETFIPACRTAAFYGAAVVRIRPEDKGYAEFSARDGFAQICVDILSERGYNALYETEEAFLPSSFDTRTGRIVSKRRLTHVFHVKFPRARLTGALADATVGKLSVDVEQRG